MRRLLLRQFRGGSTLAPREAALELHRPPTLEGLGLLELFHLALEPSLACVLLALLVLRHLRRRSQREEDPRSPKERALERLAALREREPVGFPAMHEDAVKSSGLLRQYVAEQFIAPALRQTTEELTSSDPLAERLDDRQCSTLRFELDHCDHIKFARRIPATKQRFARLDAIESFVLETSDRVDGEDSDEAESAEERA